MKLQQILKKMALLSVLLLIYAFLLLPVFIVVITSFTTQSTPAIPSGTISFEWYASLLTNDQLIEAMRVSFIVAIASSALSVIIGATAAIGFVRGKFPYKQTISSLLLFPMIISPVITGFALVRFFGSINVSAGYPSLIIAHTVLTLPYVFLLVRSELTSFDETLEDASRTLGADASATFANVTAPLIAPGLFGGFFIAFVVSFGEFTATQFLISPNTTTVPVIIYTMIQTGLTPAINALASVLVCIMVGLSLINHFLD